MARAAAGMTRHDPPSRTDPRPAAGGPIETRAARGGRQDLGGRVVTHRNRSRRSRERRSPMAGSSRSPMAGSSRSPAPIIVELAANAPAPTLAAAEAAVRAAAPLAAVELVRVRAMTLPRGEPIRIRGVFIGWDAPASVQRRHARAMAAFAAALEAALAAAGGSGDRA